MFLQPPHECKNDMPFSGDSFSDGRGSREMRERNRELIIVISKKQQGYDMIYGDMFPGPIINYL